MSTAFLIAVSVLWTASLSATTLEDVMSMDVVVHFIDVGVGDAILIDLPDPNHEVIIDGGDRRRGFDFLEYAAPFIDGPIELAVVTHPDYDHWSGIGKLVQEQYEILQIWDPGYSRDCKFTGTQAEKKREKDQYLKYIRAVSGPSLKRPVPTNPVSPLLVLDGVELSVLHADPDPPGPSCSYKVNNASIVLKLQYGNVKFLFTGDANGKSHDARASAAPEHVEAKLLELENQQAGLLSAHVLKAPHHGSETANTLDFIRAVGPRFVVISSSYTPHYELPEKRVIQRYQRVRFGDREKIEAVLRTNYGERNYDSRRFGDDHILCGTNGSSEDLVCGYIWAFEE